MQDLFTEQNPIFKPKKLEQIRIPWTGSKRSIAPQLIDKMLEVKPKAKYFVDLFCGGCAVSFTALQYGFKVHANDMQKSLINFLEYTFDRIQRNERNEYGLFPAEWYKFVTREEFIKQRELDTPFSQFVRICYSFGNNQKDYLFSKEIEGWKRLAHDIIVFRCEKSLKEFNQIFEIDLVLSNKKTVNERRLDYRASIHDNIQRNPFLKEMISKGFVKNFTEATNPKINEYLKLNYLKNADDTCDNQELIRLNSLEKLKELQGMKQMQNIFEIENIGEVEKLQQCEHIARIEACNNVIKLKSLYKIIQNPQLEQLEQHEKTKIIRTSQIERMENLVRMQKNQRLEQLEQLEQLEHIPSLTFSSLSYDEVIINTPLDETIVYCDIPYRGTHKYLEGKDFNYEAFYKWFENNKYSCFLSEYNAPFSPILEIPKMKLFNNKGVEKREYAIEKLFWNGK